MQPQAGARCRCASQVKSLLDRCIDLANDRRGTSLPGFDGSMPVELQTPRLEELGEVVEALSEWQHDGAPVQLHPGDIGWYWRFGASAVARSLRVWRQGGDIVAIGLLDSSPLIRMAVVPMANDDEGVADNLVSDLSDPGQGVLRVGERIVEARFGAAFRALLAREGWVEGERWTPLVRDLASVVEGHPMHVEVVGPRRVHDRVTVQRSAFGGSTFTARRWRTMAAGSPYRRGRCLVGYDDKRVPVATVTVWSAGPGRPGLLEPMGVHRDHRGRGYGTAISVAAAAALKAMGSSTAIVATPSSNVAGVATYAAARFRPMPEVADFRRET
jgi:GNAT superfamily N-acetyltransferase